MTKKSNEINNNEYFVLTDCILDLEDYIANISSWMSQGSIILSDAINRLNALKDRQCAMPKPQCLIDETNKLKIREAWNRHQENCEAIGKKPCTDSFLRVECEALESWADDGITEDDLIKFVQNIS